MLNNRLTVMLFVTMVKWVLDRSEVLDRAFHALSDPSRRQMLDWPDRCR